MRNVGVGLGSNQGDRLEHLRAALRWLESVSETELLYSHVYETKPMDCAKDAPPFLNAVCEISSDEDPLELLRRMRAFERERGRPEFYSRNDPRPLDMDILYAGDLTLDTEELKLPHPRILERRFVLQPLADIRPELILPETHQTVGHFLASLTDAGDVRLYQEPLR